MATLIYELLKLRDEKEPDPLEVAGGRQWSGGVAGSGVVVGQAVQCSGGAGSGVVGGQAVEWW